MVRTVLVALLFLSLGSDLRAQDVVDQRVAILWAAARHAARVASDETGRFVSVYDIHPSSESEEDGPGLEALAAELGRSVATVDEIVTCEASVCRSVDGSRAGFELSAVRLQGSQGLARLETWFLDGDTGSLSSLRGRVDQVHLVGSDGVWSVADFRTLPQP